VGQYGVKNNSSDTINYRDNTTSGIKLAKPAPFFWGTLFGLIDGTWEAAYKCQGKCAIRTT